jgi:hypothetical protein
MYTRFSSLPRDVDGRDLRKAEVPEKTRVDEGSDETTRCGVYMDINFDVTLN